MGITHADKLWAGLFLGLALIISLSSAVCSKEKKKDKYREKIPFDSSWEYASASKINTGEAVLYRAEGSVVKDITVCVNAGHGTEGGDSVMVQCHPDGSAKIVSGSTKKGATKAAAVAGGMTFEDGTPEAEATLSLAVILKDKLLDAGYNVLMIREEDDVQLDNIARTVMANNNADCHIALHYDDSTSDKGAFYMSVPDVDSYKEMEPVKSCWKEHDRLGDDVIDGLKEHGIRIFSDGHMAMDLTQTSYSTIPSIDLEVGDGGSDISEKHQKKIAAGILEGLDDFFEEDQDGE